jgi:hypothetical protein
MITHRGFLFNYGSSAGLGVTASSVDPGWTRINLYGDGRDLDPLQVGLTAVTEPRSEGEQVGFSHPAPAASIAAGGLVFRGISLLSVQPDEPLRLLGRLTQRLAGLRIMPPGKLVSAAVLEPGATYWGLYRERIPALVRLVRFDYAMQLVLMGMCRERDLPLVDDWCSELGRLRDLVSVPKPLCTRQADARVNVNIFMVRAPLHDGTAEELSKRLVVFPGMRFYETGNPICRSDPT